MDMKRNIFILALVLAAVIVVIATNWESGEKRNASGDGSVVDDVAVNLPEAPKKGAMAPAFKLKSLDGTEDYGVGGQRDKVLIVNFWASWCGPCEKEAPDLVDIFNKHKNEVDLYAVNATNYDKLRNAKVFVREQGFEMPVLTDADGAAGDLYKVYSYPTSFIVGRDGVILQRIEGLIDRKQWEKYLEEAIKA